MSKRNLQSGRLRVLGVVVISVVLLALVAGATAWFMGRNNSGLSAEAKHAKLATVALTHIKASFATLTPPAGLTESTRASSSVYHDDQPNITVVYSMKPDTPTTIGDVVKGFEAQGFKAKTSNGGNTESSVLDPSTSQSNLELIVSVTDKAVFVRAQELKRTDQ